MSSHSALPCAAAFHPVCYPVMMSLPDTQQHTHNTYSNFMNRSRWRMKSRKERATGRTTLITLNLEPIIFLHSTEGPSLIQITTSQCVDWRCMMHSASFPRNGLRGYNTSKTAHVSTQNDEQGQLHYSLLIRYSNITKTASWTHTSSRSPKSRRPRSLILAGLLATN